MRAQAAGHCWHVRVIVAAIACVALALLARTCGLRSHALVSPHPRLLAIPNAPGFVFSVITGLADARAGDRPRTPPLAEGATDRAQQSEVRLGMARSPARLCQLLDVRQHACVSSCLHPRRASARVIPLRQVADANLVRPCPCSASLVRTRASPFELLPAVAAPAAAHAAAALARAPAPRAPGKRARPPRALLALSRPQPPRALEDTPELGTCSPSPRHAGAVPRAPLARTRQKKNKTAIKIKKQNQNLKATRAPGCALKAPVGTFAMVLGGDTFGVSNAFVMGVRSVPPRAAAAAGRASFPWRGIVDVMKSFIVTSFCMQ